ncbi:hypothetical protein AMECASPLE_013178 [Ameca splendens]|uniref:Uncharacterized protein n=1 Tax=Ameca splendens TaxID=208324 RepID=A0ABV0ZMV1_9TELE
MTLASSPFNTPRGRGPATKPTSSKSCRAPPPPNLYPSNHFFVMQSGPSGNSFINENFQEKLGPLMGDGCEISVFIRDRKNKAKRMVNGLYLYCALSSHQRPQSASHYIQSSTHSSTHSHTESGELHCSHSYPGAD